MRIVFIGNPVASQRMAPLAELLGAAGHEVTLITRRNLARRMGRFTVRAWWRWRQLRPEVVHIHGFGAGWLAWVAALINNSPTMVWTIDTIPAWPRWMIRMYVRGVSFILDALTVTRRDVQYQLLNIAGVRAAYIPDGYTPPYTATLSVRRWQVWPQRYCVASVGSEAEEKLVQTAYAATGSRRPLLLLSSGMSSRVRAALFQHAAVIVLANATDTAETALLAMASGRPMVALARPGYEELLGITAQYVHERDEEALARTVRHALRGEHAARQMRLERMIVAASRRAERHFTWERIVFDYLPLYRPSARLTPLDSATIPLVRVAKWQPHQL